MGYPNQAPHLVVGTLLFFLAIANAAVHESHLEQFRRAFLENPLTLNLDSAVTITVTPSNMDAAGWVTVKWSGVSKPHKSDIIALYSPPNSDYTSVSPVKYQKADKDHDYIHTGKGTLKFFLVNMHSDYVFVLISMASNEVKAVSNQVTFSNLDAPLQPHLALTQNANEMRVMWATGEANSTQWLKWGTQTGVYTWKVRATSYTYTADEMCGSPATDFGWKDPGMLHTAVATKLAPFKTYYYVYGNDESSGWGPESMFQGPPPAGNTNEVFIAAYGDMGKGEVDGSHEHWPEPASLNTTKNVYALVDELDLVLHIGDIAYAVGYSAQWDEFMHQISDVASRVPYMTCPGNHETDFPNTTSYFHGHDSGGECGVPFFNRFLMPGQHKNHYWYSFDYGVVHFLLMSTEHDFTIGSDQNNFLEQDLASVDRSITPWVVFGGHRPMYIDSKNDDPDGGDQPVAALLRQHVEPMLVKYSVDIALWGHHHSYQRSCPVFQEQCQDSTDFPVHVVIGMAGFDLTKNLEATPPPWLVYVDDQEWGYSTMRFNSTSLHFQFFSNTAGLRDEFYLYQ